MEKSVEDWKTFQGQNLNFCVAIPIKCFVSHRPVSCDGGSVGRLGKKKKKKKKK